jgi:3',5'-cyclic AMP phosphodiesterase CpdA
VPVRSLLATSDLHVTHEGNWPIVENIRPGTDDDWLIVAGDVAESTDMIGRTLAMFTQRFAKVIWTPGNHELWTVRDDGASPRGTARYDQLVALCRSIGVVTPEDEYPIWETEDGAFAVAPLFLLYDYSFRPDGALSKDDGLARAYQTGIVCSDEWMLHPDPYPSREAWCWARIEATERRLARLDPALPVIFVNHYPLIREPTAILRYPQFAQWCGTTRTHDWHTRFNTSIVVYGHLHIPRVTWHDGVKFIEASIGYPREWREWQRRGFAIDIPRQILPSPEAPPP